MTAKARPRLLLFPIAFAAGWLVACGGDSPLAAVPTQTPMPTAQAPLLQPTPANQPPAQAEQPAGGPQDYVVQPGDTLGSIAGAFGVTVEQIVEANELDDPDLIFPGQTLVIPEPGDQS